ncbi:hypothetical protein BKA93DRAFT_755994 [Sparassis latifolia]
MSSSSTTACSRSPSPSPATPDSSDTLEPVVTQEELVAWCNSLSSGFLVGDEAQFLDNDKREQGQILDLEDLLQVTAYEDSPPPAQEYKFPSPDSAALSGASSPSSLEIPDLLACPRGSGSMKPIPPPPSQPRRDPSIVAQRVVYPSKDSCYNLPILIPSIPEGGTKSRVETQVRLTVDLAHASASSGEPFKYDRVGSWKWLRLPKGTSTKRRTRKEGKVETQVDDTLYLTAEVTCASSPHTPVTCCASCQTREAKRVARKIAARVRPARSDSDSPDEARTIPGRGKHEDTSNLLQFNCPEVMDFSTGSVVLPLRITCYCRHHREKVGFNVHFSMLDRTGRIVGTGTTRPIMITDDHKSTGVNSKSATLLGGFERSQIDRSSRVAGDSEKRPTKRKIREGSDRTKKRTKPYDVGRSACRGSQNTSDGSLDSPKTPSSTFVSRPTSPLHSLASSVLSQPGPSRQLTSSRLDHSRTHSASTAVEPVFDISQSVGQLSSTRFDPDISLPSQISVQSVSLDQLANSFLPTTPSSPIPLALNPVQTLNVPRPPSMSFTLFKHDPPPSISSLPPPRIHRLIPSSGPTYGGIEVTVLGANFHTSMQLNCVFGGSPASSTQRWSDNTLVCLLPPSTNPGVVPVWFDGIPKEENGTPACLFAYTDETDRALMELALQVVGLKMTGKIEDARNVAMRIVSNTDSNDSGSGIAASDAMQLANDSATRSLDIRRVLLSRAGDNGDFESLILDFLSILDVPVPVQTASLSSSISHQSGSGQTLLHLATFLNFPTLVSFLVSHEIDVDARDRNGCTALCLAAIVKSTQCAKILTDAGASFDIVNAWGKTPAQIAPSGFFDFVSSESGHTDQGCDADDSLDDESAWGDVEDHTDDEVEVKQVRRHHPRKFLHRMRKTIHPPAESDKDTEQRPAATQKSEEKKELKLQDEKQAVAPFMETLFRTLAQLQHPQGMIPNMPNLPPLHLPQIRGIPGIPAWNALSQMPAVFPVFVPIPALSAIFGEKRAGEVQSEGTPGTNGQAWLGMLTVQDWRAIWEKWMTQVSMSAKETTEFPPPAYTPRSEGTDATAVEVREDDLPSVGASSATADRVVARHVGYNEDMPIPEQEVNAYAYRPARKPSRRSQKKSDRMLVLFWIPILLIGVAWAFLHFARVAFHATRAVVGYKAGLRV